MPNVTLFGDFNVTTNDTDDYAEPASTPPPRDYSSTLQPSLSRGPLPLFARLPAPATNGKTSQTPKVLKKRQLFDSKKWQI